MQKTIFVQAKAWGARYTVEGHQNGAIKLSLNFSVRKFLPKFPKTLKFGKNMLLLWQMIPNKIN